MIICKNVIIVKVIINEIVLEIVGENFNFKNNGLSKCLMVGFFNYLSFKVVIVIFSW